ncbi:pilus assembly protein [Sphingomonas sp. AP4-R1]|uniref:TadE/TadG family type IV pilus assembly protein n=1 Tax=Sphingomonas sp. AP4-R1 TaxID=2735134 RepID=UPI0014933CA3|nr:TadE/TadG family type IV pilus assembly protein [Sphingomonas sp. AP4-R1]QJU57912.1 pilus assembly protein [Sphingomonas sp. AP4-R1]
MSASLRRLRGAERGVVLVEMGLALPLVLLVGLGGLEVARYSLTVLRMNQIAAAVADNAGRVRQGLDETDVNEIMIGGKLMGGSDFAANGRIILSDLEQRTNTSGSNGTGATSPGNPNGYRQWIRWQRCAGALSRTSSYGVPTNGSGVAVVDLDSKTNADHGAVEKNSILDGMGPAGQQISAAGGTAVMVVEVFYTYRPMVPFYSFATSSIHVFEAYNIRQRTDFTVSNGAKLSGNGRSDCRLFNTAVPAA